MKNFFLTFIPIFVAIDVLGMVPLYLSLTRDLSRSGRKQLILQAVTTAFFIAIVFVLTGNTIFHFLGITISDFKIAGGLILLVLAVRELALPADNDSKKPADTSEMGVVPLGIPLILGPAVLTALLILVDSYGYSLTLASLFLNLVIVCGVLWNAPLLERIVRKNGANAIAKVSSLFMSAIAVMMIRKGLMEIWIR